MLVKNAGIAVKVGIHITHCLKFNLYQYRNDIFTIILLPFSGKR